MKRPVLLLLISALGACTAETEPSSLSASEIRAEIAMTPGATQPQYTDAQLECFIDTWRHDAILPYVVCQKEAANGLHGDDECFYAETHGLVATSRARSFATACFARAEECNGEFLSDLDGCDRYSELRTDTNIGMFEACLDVPCGEFSDCYDDALFCGLQ